MHVVAMAPPKVTNWVPGVTGKNQPCGTTSTKISDSSIPASARRIPVAGSKAMKRSRPRVSNSVPPSFRHTSP